MIEARVRQLVEEKIEDRPDLFLVKVTYSPNGKVSVLMDGDSGITIKDCAAISRHVGYHLEEEDLIQNSYQLEVSSPGLDQPLVMARQFEKNVGRNIRITLHDGEKIEGKLIKYDPYSLTLEKKSKEKGNKPKLTEELVPVTNIKETKVLISFK